MTNQRPPLLDPAWPLALMTRLDAGRVLPRLLGDRLDHPGVRVRHPAPHAAHAAGARDDRAVRRPRGLDPDLRDRARGLQFDARVRLPVPDLGLDPGGVRLALQHLDPQGRDRNASSTCSPRCGSSSSASASSRSPSPSVAIASPLQMALPGVAQEQCVHLRPDRDPLRRAADLRDRVRSPDRRRRCRPRTGGDPPVGLLLPFFILSWLNAPAAQSSRRRLGDLRAGRHPDRGLDEPRPVAQHRRRPRVLRRPAACCAATRARCSRSGCSARSP